jgi:hypothetical protein
MTLPRAPHPFRPLGLLALCAALPLLALTMACPPPPNFLDGSIKTSHDLDFDTVELRILTDQSVYQVTYFKNLDEEAGAAGGQDTIAKITFNEPAGGAVVDQPIDLTSAEAEGRVERITARDDPFPPDLDRGTVTFLTTPVVDEVVKGDIAITFSNGKTLNGAFETPLIAISL